MRKLYIALAIVIGLLYVLLPNILIEVFEIKPTPDIVTIKGQEFIRSKVSGGYVYTKIN